MEYALTVIVAFSFGNSLSAKNVIIFGCDMSFSSHANNRASNIYVLGKDFIQGINGTPIYAKKLCKTDFTQQDKKFVLPLHYNGDDSYLFINGVQQLRFKTKYSEIKRVLLCLGNISTNFSTTNAQKTGLFGNVYVFAVYYVPISGVKTIYDVHRYLMIKKCYCIKMFGLIKKVLIGDIDIGVNVSYICSLKIQKCKVREVIENNEYMTFPYNIKVNKCNGNCNNISNPYCRVCIRDIVKNVTVKIFDLMALTNKTRQIIFHESCKCVCRLDPIVCNNKQKWNEDKCRCECLVNKKCDDDFVWNINNFECEYRKKAATLTTEEECEVLNDDTEIASNKIILIKENHSVEDCKPFVASSILFLLVVIILTGLLIYFYLNLRSKNVSPY